jgi:hypothetical protein
MDSTDHGPCETNSCSASTQPRPLWNPTQIHQHQFWVICVHSKPYHVVCLWYILILFTNVMPMSPERCRSFRFPRQTLHASLFSCMLATCHTQLNLLGFIFQIIFDKGYIINYLTTGWRPCKFACYTTLYWAEITVSLKQTSWQEVIGFAL